MLLQTSLHLFVGPAWLVENVASPGLCSLPREAHFEVGSGEVHATSLFVFIHKLGRDGDILERLFACICGGTNGRGMTGTWRRHNESITSPSRWSSIPALSTERGSLRIKELFSMMMWRLDSNESKANHIRVAALTRN